MRKIDGNNFGIFYISIHIFESVCITSIGKIVIPIISQRSEHEEAYRSHPTTEMSSYC